MFDCRNFTPGKGKFADLGKNGNRKAENDEQKL